MIYKKKYQIKFWHYEARRCIEIYGFAIIYDTQRIKRCISKLLPEYRLDEAFYKITL